MTEITTGKNSTRAMKRKKNGHADGRRRQPGKTNPVLTTLRHELA
jgi:hypothetical protein